MQPEIVYCSNFSNYEIKLLLNTIKRRFFKIQYQKMKSTTLGYKYWAYKNQQDLYDIQPQKYLDLAFSFFSTKIFI